MGDAVDLVPLPERHQPMQVDDIDLLNLHAPMVFVLDEAGSRQVWKWVITTSSPASRKRAPYAVR